jgi:hypothetical protein
MMMQVGEVMGEWFAVQRFSAIVIMMASKTATQTLSLFRTFQCIQIDRGAAIGRPLGIPCTKKEEEQINSAICSLKVN